MNSAPGLGILPLIVSISVVPINLMIDSFIMDTIIIAHSPFRLLVRAATSVVIKARLYFYRSGLGRLCLLLGLGRANSQNR